MVESQVGYDFAQAFYAFDTKSNNFVTANDIATSNMAFRLPFTLDELRYFLENETVFKHIPNITIDNFVKYFFLRRDIDPNRK